MNEFHEPHALGPADRDPLERLVEAFVELSVPEGPDAAVQRRLLATLTAGPVELATSMPRAAAPAQARSNFGKAFALAASILVMVAASLWMLFGRGPDAGAPVSNQLAADDSPLPAGALPDNMLELLDYAAEAQRDPSAPRSDIFALINAMLKEQARRGGWRRAQERIAVALEQPEVIGVGVGLLGTLPWATHGRF